MLSENDEFRSSSPVIDQIAQVLEQVQNKIFIYEQLDHHSNKPLRRYTQSLIIADLKRDLESGKIFKGIFNNLDQPVNIQAIAITELIIITELIAIALALPNEKKLIIFPGSDQNLWENFFTTTRSQFL